MKIVIAPDKLKGSLTGFEYCNAVEEGLRLVLPNAEVIKKPLADGGDGTLDVISYYTQGKEVHCTVNDALFRPLETAYIFSKTKHIAFIEMSEVAGLKLLAKSEQNCMYTTSLGFGELIRDAIDKGAREVVLAIGGSATNDGGMGMAQALGYRFLDAQGKVLKPIGENLSKIKQIDTTHVHPKLDKVTFKVACDVTNPLYGKNGAAYVYGPQKGASEQEVHLLDTGLRNYAEVVSTTFGIDIQHVVGAGAAGGMGAGAKVFLNGELISGIDLVMEIANFEDAIRDADWIITGEGNLDGQTKSGKTISGILNLAKAKNIPVAALCGKVSLSNTEIEEMGLAYAISISEGSKNLEEALRNAYQNLSKAAEHFGNKVVAQKSSD